MTDVETNEGADASEAKARKPRKRNDERRIFVYRMIDGKPRELGSFPETSIGSPLERRLPVFLRDFFGDGEYKAEIRKPNGHFERSIDFSIAEDEKPSRIEFEPELGEGEINESEDFQFDGENRQMNALEVENLLLKERLKRIEEDLTRQKSGNQSETQTLITALEDSRREQRELLMLMLTNAQKPPQPQQDPTTLMLSMLKGTLEVQRGVRELSEEIAPNDSTGGSSFLADGAKLVDSIGRNAKTFLPMLTNSLLNGRKAAPANHSSPISNGNGAAATNGAGGNASNLAEMFAKIPKKENEK